MLEEIYIRNIAIIDDLKIDFSPGFNVLTGESGSGKSLIAGALGMLKGNKSDTSVIRNGSDSAEVSGVFSVGSSELDAWMKEKGILPEDGVVIVRRILKSNGRNSITVQSVPVSKNDLMELSSFLFDIHGQHEHHTLMSEERQRSLLDSFAGLTDDVSDFSSQFAELGRLKKKLSEMEVSEQERLREIDILRFSISEIAEARIIPGEDSELEEEHKILAEHEKLYRLVDEAHESLSSGHGSIISQVKHVENSISSAALIDKALSAYAERVSNCFFELEDISQSLRDYMLNDNFSPERLAACEERLSVFHRLKKKYGNTADEILGFLSDSKEKLSVLENIDEDRSKLKAEIKKLEENVTSKAAAISDKRKKKAQELKSQIETVLSQLGMPNVSFSIAVAQKKNEAGRAVCSASGFDRVEFLISPNKGEPLKPIDQIASGGELSRIMLAVKSVLSENDPVDSMLFDEIDSGIGGDIAVSLGYYLQKLSENKQIICITHLASIAANADNHIRVKKVVDGQRTLTKTDIVSGEERTEEVARMLSGRQSRDVSLEHARALLQKKVPGNL